MSRMMVLINNVMGLKNIITIAFLGIGDTLLIFLSFCSKSGRDWEQLC
jgi:hypothetical protein